MFQVSTLKIVQHQLSKYIPYLGVYVFRKYDVIKISFVKQSTPLHDLYIVLTQFSNKTYPSHGNDILTINCCITGLQDVKTLEAMVKILPISNHKHYI